MDAPSLLCVTAHPDDEAMAFGGALAAAAAAGIATTLAVATRGEHGWAGGSDGRPSSAAIAAIRDAELRDAAAVLGIGRIETLGYEDGRVDAADAVELIGRLASCIRRARPRVVLTFAADGAYGHPDHIAVSQATTAAVVCAADSTWPAPHPRQEPPHRVAGLYQRIWTTDDAARFAAAFGAARIDIDGVVRGEVAWPEWAAAARLDVGAHWRTVRDAVACHRSQLADPDAFARLPDETHRAVWGTEAYLRAFCLDAVAREVERGPFAGLPVRPLALASA